MRKAHNWITGQAIAGDKRGTALGFPTANLTLTADTQRPADGIYACWAQLEDQPTIWPAVLHAGPRPTFPGASPTVEVHLLSFPYQELYGQTIAFECMYKIRDIVHFSSPEKLIAAMQQDCIQAQHILTLQAA